LPDVKDFTVQSKAKKISVTIEDNLACKRYCGVSLNGIEVKESPDWLQNKLKSIGLRPINNVVDCTNYVLHETGQPLHAFDADKLKGSKIVVKKNSGKTKFTGLDGIERELSSEDLVICDAENVLCIAGVFGGLDSGVSDKSTSVFLESAYFDSVSVRKTAKRHALKTDASFRFERGTDPNACLYALKRAAMLIQQVAGGEISMETIDVYPTKVENFSVRFSFANCARLIGKKIDNEVVKNIILALGIDIKNEESDTLHLEVPAFKVDVQREVDVIEEVLRIYGYNQIDLPAQVNSSLSFATKPNREKIQNTVADLLSSNGFAEIMSLSLSPSAYLETTETNLINSKVAMLNPLSSDLDVLRQTLLYSGLEAIAYNQNRKRSDLRNKAVNFFIPKKIDSLFS
jgi:phenylalanyl-tRNA synthetase beta chain